MLMANSLDQFKTKSHNKLGISLFRGAKLRIYGENKKNLIEVDFLKNYYCKIIDFIGLN